MPCPRPRLPARDVAGIVREQPELPSAELLSRLSPSPDTLRTGRCGSRIRPDVVAALRPNAEPPRARSAVRPPRLMKRSAQRQKRARPCSPFIRRRPHPNPHSAPPAPCDTTSSAPARRLGTYLLDNPPSSALPVEPPQVPVLAARAHRDRELHRFALRPRGASNGSRPCAVGPSMSARARTSAPQSGHVAGCGNRHVDRELRTAAQARPRHRLSTRRIHRRKMRPQ